MARTLYLVEIDNGQEYEDWRTWVLGIYNNMTQAEQAAQAKVKELNTGDYAYSRQNSATINPIVVGQEYNQTYKTETIVDRNGNIIHPLETK